MSSGIYCIENLINHKVYIGSASNLRCRWSRHIENLLNEVHDNIHLQSAWNKYGKNGFQFWIIEEVETKACLVDREQFYLNLFRDFEYGVYNKRLIACSNEGLKWSEETKRKMSIAKKNMSLGTRLKMSIAKQGNQHSLGIKRSEESIRKQRESWKKKRCG